MRALLLPALLLCGCVYGPEIAVLPESIAYRCAEGRELQVRRTPDGGKQNKVNVLPAKLGLLTHLRVLVSEGHHFTNSDVKDIGCVRTMKALTHLDLWGNRLVELGPLAELAELRSLNVNKNFVADLGPLRGATALEVLAVDNNQLESIDVLSGLTNLRQLHLRGNRVRDLAVLERLPKLEVLAIEANPVDDLSVLAKLPSLRFLNVGLHLLDAAKRALVEGLSIARVV